MGANATGWAVRWRRRSPEAFGGIKEIKALGREAFLSALEKKLRDVLDLGYVAKTMEASAPLFTEAVFVGGALAVIALLTEGGAGRRAPLLALFAYSAFRVVPSVNRFAWRANQIRGTARAARRSLRGLPAYRQRTTCRRRVRR